MALSKKAQAMLDQLGIKLKPSDFENVDVNKTEPAKEMAKWEAQSLLISLTWPYPDLVPVICRNSSCGKKFLTNYKANVYCSMECHKVELEKRGLVWRPERSFYEQWGNLEPPLMIPPEAIKAMRRLLSIIDHTSPVISRNQEQDFGGVHKEQLLIEDDVSLDPQVPYNDPDIQEEPDEDQDDFLALLASQDD